MKKIILLLAFYILCLDPVFSQEIEWQNTIGGNAADFLYCIRQTTDGGYIMGGTSCSDLSGDKTENSMSSWDYWIVKIDASGTIQWQNTIGGDDDDILNSIQQTADGGYIMGGHSLSGIYGDKTENSQGMWDYWIVKTDSLGNIQWQNTIGGNNQDYLESIEQTADGGYILGGSSVSGYSGDKTEIHYGGRDYWIVKTDASGTIQWQNTIGGDDDDILNSIQQTADGGYILGGYSLSNISVDKTENSMGLYDYWIVKTDLAGNVQWQNTIGGNADDELNSINQTVDGGYILGGWSESNISGDKTENSNGGRDYWIVKTDSLGNIQWQNTIGGSFRDELNSIQQTTDGGYFLGGRSESNISGDKTENSNGSWDYWIVKTDSLGNIQWQNSIGGSDIEWLYSIQQTANGGFILGGFSWSNISGDKTENCITGADYWIVKVTDKYNYITGKLFIDSNGNNVQDAGEPDLVNKPVTEVNTGRFGYSQQNGSYKIVVLDSGNFTVNPPSFNYYTVMPATYSTYFAGIHQTDSLNDFAFQPLGVFNDLCVTITPIGVFRPNQNASYMINYENVGTTTLNGTVIFFPDNDVTYVSSSVTPTSITTDSVIWNVGTLTPFQTGSILVTVHVNAGTPIGTLINSSVEIDPVVGDADISCNYNAYEVFVTAPVDPNAILVDRDTVLTTELSSPPYLNYIIYFQNTGNDTAFNVKVLNPMDTFKLDIHSFEFVASSHPVNIEYKIWERNMYFTFDNILLPDSGVNEPASHGFIRYKIKPVSTLVVADSIKNNAAIYFDFNQPVLTNTAVTEIVLPTGIAGQTAEARGQLVIFPNPVRDELIVNSNSLTGKKAEIKIYDLYGREVFQLETLNFKLQTKINVSRFSQGIYFVELQSGEKVLRGKFLKE